MKEVKDIKISRNLSLDELVRQYYESGGFVAKKIGMGVEILKNMFEECEIKILSFPACITATGVRGVIKDMIKNKFFDIVITTCGTLDHDFARSFKDYYHGRFDADDVELHKKGINRLGNVFVPNESYGIIIEEKLKAMLKEIYQSGKKEMASYEFINEIGKRINNEDSIIHWCAKNDVKMIVPGITDGAVGFQLMMFMNENKDFKIDVFKDEFYLTDKLFKKVKTGALIIGGGISKHHVIWWSQFSAGLDYAVYITTASEYDGSLSGARPREAISWGKLGEKAKHVTIEGDATVILPLVIGPFL